MAIITRLTSGPEVVVKGQSLTYEELDQNFIDLVSGKYNPFGVKNSNQLAAANNTVFYGQVVFISDLNEIPSGNTYTINEFGQLIPLFYDVSKFQYDKRFDCWEAIESVKLLNAIIEEY